jgi:hypothetical protein
MMALFGKLTFDPLGDRAEIFQQVRHIGKRIADTLLPGEFGFRIVTEAVLVHL